MCLLHSCVGVTLFSCRPGFFTHFPTLSSSLGITKMNSRGYLMPQSGAQILYNTVDFREKFMTWAISCALTPECMFPNYELSEVRIPYASRYNPYGSFELKHCDIKNPSSRPFNCHRFDQSLFAILAQNMYNYDLSKYRTTMEEWPATPDRTAGRNKKTPWGMISTNNKL